MTIFTTDLEVSCQTPVENRGLRDLVTNEVAQLLLLRRGARILKQGCSCRGGGGGGYSNTVLPVLWCENVQLFVIKAAEN